MQLVNMEVDRHGTDARCYLGPFSAGLNAICGPRGSGKTTLLGWLRQIAAERYGLDYGRTRRDIPLGMSGSLTIRDRGRTFRAINTRDGHTDYNQSDGTGLEHLHASGWAASSGASSRTWLSPTQREAFSGLTAAHGAADTEAELLGLAQRLGMQTSDANHPSQASSQLEARRIEIVNQLARIGSLSASREELLARREDLEAELVRARGHASQPTRADAANPDRLDARWIAAKEDLEATTAEISAIDQQLAQRQADLKLFETNNAAVEVSVSYRAQLQEMDDRLNRWRRTLRDLRAHRQSIETNATDLRLDEQVGDQLAPTKQPDPRGALRALEASILSSRKQLDEMVGRGGSESTRQSGEYEVVRQPDGQTRLVCTDTHRTVTETSPLPDLLRLMQKDLYEVCQQLARHQAQAASEKLANQTSQLQRAEAELLASVEKLIEERASLLRKIAVEHDLSLEKLTLAFGQWSQCQDHPNLQQWLLQDESSRQPKLGSASMEDRHRLLEEIESLRSRRQQLQLHCDQCRRQLRDADVHHRSSLVAGAEASSLPIENDLSNQLHAVIDDLNRQAEHDRLTAELSDIQRRLSIPASSGRHDVFAANVNSHIKAMMGPFSPAGAERRYRGNAPRQYDPVDGVISDLAVEYETYEKTVPSSIVRIAQRLAIAEGLAARGEAICLVLDETLDNLSATAQRRVLEHLAIVAEHGQQIVVMTCDERIAQDVRGHRGWVGYIEPVAAEVHRPVDVNQTLAAFANEEEADKWYKPKSTPDHSRDLPARSEYYLTDSSLIEELPSLDSATAARCRGLGVDSIGDLLDTDPAWLADQLDVGDRAVERLQAEANLLCSVRNLRPFDARVLVGAGIRSASQLATIHPGKLLARVEDFLQTDRGRQILSSGSRYELSRIRSWISEAKNGAGRYQRSSHNEAAQYERSRASSTRSSDASTSRDALRSSSRSSGSSRGGDDRRNNSNSRNGSSRNGSSRSRSRSRRERESSDSQYSVVGRNGSSSSSRTQMRVAQTHEETASASLKFYLDPSSPVVDAPTIGPRMAERLAKHGVFTVAHLLAANPASLADKLNNRRVDADIVHAWQLQAQLVCRIPNLRGHDAQMLVACDIHSPEILAAMEADSVLQSVTEFARTSDGQRVLRGSKEPDLAEVNDWIAWSRKSRVLNAA